MSYNYVTNRDARNFTPGPQVPAVFGFPRTITNITLHWWGKPEWRQTWEQVMWFFCDNPNVGTSAHEVISDGIVGCIVDHSNAAWANGNSKGNAQSITLECNPRMSLGDKTTVAQRIADIWRMHGRIIPLTEHRDWFATECSGTWDKNEITRMAMAAYKGVAKEIQALAQNGDLSVADINSLNQKLDKLTQLIEYMISYSQPGREGINRDSELASWQRGIKRTADDWAPGRAGINHPGRAYLEFVDLKAKVENIDNNVQAIHNTIQSISR